VAAARAVVDGADDRYFTNRGTVMTARTLWSNRSSGRFVRAFAATLFAAGAVVSTVPTVAAQAARQRAFATPEDAVRALADSAKASNLNDLIAIFGPEGQDLVSSSDPATARTNREVFMTAFSEKWQLVDQGANDKVLVIGNEGWPFPVPLTKAADGWRFNTAAGKEEILDRRIGRNELLAIEAAATYVKAQRRYASEGHDGKPAGLFASTFRSDPGRQNGLYWPTAKGQKPSPLGDLVAQAATGGQTPNAASAQPAPFRGYYFRILTGQGKNAPGGAKPYVANGDMSGGFALVAWPAQYDVTGIMTFIVNQDGVLYEKDLGTGTDAAARKMTLYDPDKSWKMVP
jgi:DUF2950 family protein